MSTSEKHTIILDDFIPYRLAILAKAVGTSLSKTYESQFGITNQQWRTLFSIARKANCSASYVVTHAALDKVQVSRALTGLIDIGLVVRKYDSLDRRNSVLNLTVEGWKTYREIALKAEKFEKKLLESLNQEETQILKIIVNKLMIRTQELEILAKKQN
jgi:DNA-binding MarR family transcriptional regulator|tara:strand:- start:71 stop:547 length:477 start_codon:yes stop_codon:yes gene_type:complete